MGTIMAANTKNVQKLEQLLGRNLVRQRLALVYSSAVKG